MTNKNLRIVIGKSADDLKVLLGDDDITKDLHIEKLVIHPLTQGQLTRVDLTLFVSDISIEAYNVVMNTKMSETALSDLEAVIQRATLLRNMLK